jgi:uncharacterized protein (TIGR00251 family)
VRYMSVSDALRKSSDGVCIDIEVIPASRIIRVGYNLWRKRIQFRLTQAAQKGKANKQLIAELSKVLNIKESDITLISGQTSHKKTIQIRGVDIDYVLSLLIPIIENN